MAISFEQPAPAGFTDLAAKYGRMAAAQQGGAGGAANAGYQANLTDNAFRQAAENQDRELRGSTANADRAAQMENAGRQRQFQLVENEQQNAQRQEQMKTQAQLQVEVQNAELTQSERIHMQRLKNTLSDVQQKVSAGEYTPEEGKEISGQIQFGISGYQMRDAHSKVLAQEAKYAEDTKQRAHINALNAIDTKQLIDSLPTMPHPVTGQPMPMQRNANGELKPVFPDEYYRPKEGKAEKPPTHNPNEFDYTLHLAKALKGEAVMRAGDDKAQQTAEAIKVVDREKEKFDRGEMTNAGQQKPQAKAQPGQPASPGSPVPQPGQPQGPAIPFTRDKPVTPEQTAIVQGYRSNVEKIASRTFSDEKHRRLATKATEEGIKLLEAYGGDARKMPAADYARLLQLQAQFDDAISKGEFDAKKAEKAMTPEEQAAKKGIADTMRQLSGRTTVADQVAEAARKSKSP